MGRLGKIILVLAFIAYPILLHTFILKEEVEMWQLMFVFAPLLAVAGVGGISHGGEGVVATGGAGVRWCDLLHRDRRSWTHRSAGGERAVECHTQPVPALVVRAHLVARQRCH